MKPIFGDENQIRRIRRYQQITPEEESYEAGKEESIVSLRATIAQLEDLVVMIEDLIDSLETKL